MGIHYAQETSNSFAVRYSAFLGVMYVETPDVKALIQEAKAQLGDDLVKQGFKGYGAESPSGEALAFLKQKGFSRLDKITGNLVSADIQDRETNGRKTSYLNLLLRDKEDGARCYLSVNLDHDSTQMLVRKLVHAELGVPTQVQMFARYGKRPGASKAYANHGVSLKQNDVEIQGDDPRRELVPTIEAAFQKLETAGLSRQDPDQKEVYAKSRATLTLAYHRALMKEAKDQWGQSDKSATDEALSEDAHLLERAAEYDFYGEESEVPF